MQSWEKIIDRHSILRTSFAWDVLERPLQIVHRPYDLDAIWSTLDLSEHHGTDFDDKLSEFCHEERVRGFDLSLPYLVRLVLVKTKDSDSDSKYKLVFTHHHLCLDGWSVANLVSELQTYYDSGCTWSAPAVSSFRDYVAVLLGRDTEKAKEFWSKELQHYEAPLPLPRPVSQPVAEVHANEQKEIHLAPELVSNIGKFLKVHRLTLNSLFQAVWALILNALTREKFVVFGSTYSGRSFVDGQIPSVGEMVGMFINTLPVGISVDTKEHVLDFLRQVQAESIKVNEYEDSSLLLVKSCTDLGPTSELFHSIVVVENYPASKYCTEEGCGSSDIRDKLVIDEEGRSDFERTNFPLTWAISLKGSPSEDIAIKAMYDGTKLDLCIIEQMLSLWSNLLDQIVSHAQNEDFRIRNLSLVTERDVEVLKSFSKDLDENFDPADLLHAKFEGQVEKQPHAIAIFDSDEQISYYELNLRANKLARVLRDVVGVHAESVVAIDMRRCVELYICILATLKLGAGYLAIEPTYPEERKSFLITNSKAVTILVKSEKYFHKKFFSISDLNLSSVDGSNLGTPVHPLNIAYYMYTSGSTGLHLFFFCIHKWLNLTTEIGPRGEY